MLVGYTQGYIKHAVRYMPSYYWEYRIPKKTGGLRIIKEPMPNLKDIQGWILQNILYKVKTHPYAKSIRAEEEHQGECAVSYEVQAGSDSRYS